MASATPARFDHYEIIAPLGKGGMGEVLRAKDTRLDREVAIIGKDCAALSGEATGTALSDRQRFRLCAGFVTSTEEASVPPFTVVLNWMAEGKR